MITLHYLPRSRAQTVIWMLEELQLEYRIEPHRRNPSTQLANDSLKAVSPLGRAPVLECDGQVFLETGAILQCLAERYPDSGLLPAERELRESAIFWLHFVEGTLMPPVVARLIMRFAKDKSPGFVRPLVKKVLDAINSAYYGPNHHQNLQFIEQHLKQSTWILGNQFTVADIMLGFPLQSLDDSQQLTDYPSLQRFVTDIKHREAHQAMMTKVRELG